MQAVNPELPMIDEEAMALQAFLGALDDIIIEPSTAAYNEKNARTGGVMTERVLGLFDTASSFYDGDMARNITLVNTLAQRLADIAIIQGCMGHGHAQEALNEVQGIYGSRAKDSHSHDMHGEDHADHNDDDFEIDPKTGKKVRKKKRRGWWFETAT